MITTFDIGGGADAKRFTLAGNKLTFKATAFKARNNTYRVNIIVKIVSMFLNTFVSLLLVISVITLSVFSGVETSATVVIRSAPSSSGFLVTVTVRVL
jgi:hypothetical protein